MHLVIMLSLGPCWVAWFVNLEVSLRDFSISCALHTPVEMTGKIYSAHSPPEMNRQIHTSHSPVVMTGGYYLTAIIVFEPDDIILPQVAAGLNFYNL